MIAPSHLMVSLAVTAAFQGAERPTGNALVDQARTLIPQYDGDHKHFLTVDERRDVVAATHLAAAALALEPDNTYALWWNGHAESLLGEDDRNREQRDAARLHFDIALDAFERASELDPDYYWAHYARGMANWRVGHVASAIRDYDLAVAACDKAIANGDSGAETIKFKARQWRADARMRAGEFDVAREEFAAFYADYGNNQWDLGYSLSETHLRERDFAGAREVYGRILENEEFRTFDQTHAQLGYLEGLVGNTDAALQHLDAALEREFTPTLYSRMWQWILTPAPRSQAKIDAELRKFLEYPPGSLSEWDRSLGQFVVGEIEASSFLERARVEHNTRMEQARDLGDLMCEVWFYVGLRRRIEADRLDDEAARRDGWLSAFEAFGRALAFDPRSFKWEWAFARKHYAELGALLGKTPVVRSTMDGVAVGDAVPGLGRAATADASARGERMVARVHSPQDEAARSWTSVDELVPGDLLLVLVRAGADGPQRFERLVVMAE